MTSELPANQRFAIARSDFIDAHNAADIAVRKLLTSFEQPSKPLMSQNIEVLVKQPAGPNYSKSEKARIERLLADLKILNGLRCDVVHSRMEVIAISGTAHAYFANVQEQHPYGRKGLVLTIAELTDAKIKLSGIAESLAIKKGLAVVKSAAA
ncbi:hypothetical protein [Altererythrobacter sp. Z27]|uniref:hypothetical protein n=1 Tax=Altererythrobacter sp. Z27 TaxID=3461147 RepID=UPI00404421A1